MEKTLAISGSRLHAKIICNACKCIHTIARHRVEPWNVAITPLELGYKSGEVRLYFDEETLTEQRKLFAMKKKTQISSRTRRQISRGTSSTASLCDALLCMLLMHRYDRLQHANFRFK